jgi:hypothetical protein
MFLNILNLPWKKIIGFVQIERWTCPLKKYNLLLGLPTSKLTLMNNE